MSRASRSPVELVRRAHARAGRASDRARELARPRAEPSTCGERRSEARPGARCAAFLALAVLAGSLAGCGRPSSGDGAPAHQSLASNTDTRPFLEKVPDAPFNTLYGGVRHVVFSYQVDDVPLTLDYREQVFADGLGHFSIEALDVAQPPMTTQALDLFKLLQTHREGFLYRLRDFRIRDFALFLGNYSVADLGPPVTVCGRTCAWLDVRRQSDAQEYFHVAVDSQTGLILRCEEYAIAGQLESRVEFTEFTTTPDLANVEFYPDDLIAQPLDLGADTTPQIGFVVHAPSLVPSAFQLEKSEKVDDGTQPWARLTYGDGAEQVFFLYSVDPPPPASSEHHASNTGHGSDPAKRSVSIFHFGPWIIAQGRIGSQRLIAVGKTDESALLHMIQSALH